MGQKKITELQQISAMTDSSSIPTDNGIQTYRVTGSQLKTYFAPIYVPPSVSRIETGSGTWNKHYTFVVSGASATVGATYTNNSITFTVINTVASGNLVVLSGSGAPSASGTLTKASGTGDSTIAFSEFKAPLYLELDVVGGGAGGGAGGGSGGSPGNGQDGGASSFGTSLLTAGGGIKGLSGIGAGGNGGTNTINAPAIVVMNVPGGKGSPGGVALANGYAMGGNGGANPLGGAGPGGAYALTGSDGISYTGAGGGGGNSGAGSAGGTTSGGGGGAGGFLKALIYNPSATYSYSVGGAGTQGTPAGTGATGGGNGAPGVIVVKCHYQ